MKKLVLLLVLFTGILFSANEAKAQSLGCAAAVDLNIIPNFYSSTYSAYDPAIDYGCINTSGQYFMYGYFQVCAGGSLDVKTITSTSGNDVDIVVWGPFSNLTNICSNLTSGNIAGCANTIGYMDTVALGLVNAGDIYMVSIASDTNIGIPSIFFSGNASVDTSCSANNIPPNCAPFSGMEDFCLISVDSATQKYKLTWEKLPPNPVSYFEIYKLGLNMQYNLIDTVNYSSFSEYIDTSSNPSVYAPMYKLMTRDTCGTGWGNANGYIQSVFCQASLSSSNTINLIWSPYNDWNNQAAYYVIFRGATMGSMVPIDSVPDYVNMYTDINPLSGISYYKIGTALVNSTCVPSRLPMPVVQSYSNSTSVQVVGMHEQNDMLNISAFPNPTGGQLQLKGVNQSTSLLISDMSGRIVFSMQLNPADLQAIDLSGLEQGVYQLHFSNEKGRSVKTLVLSE